MNAPRTDAAPEDLSGGLARVRRQHRLRRLLAEARDLTQRLGVSVATVKRDLAELPATRSSSRRAFAWVGEHGG